MKELLLDSIDSPIGTVLIVVDDAKLCSLDYSDYEPRMLMLLERRYGPVHFTTVSDPGGFSSRVRDYFAGAYHALDEIPVSTGGTAFQQQVWLALRSIPSGTTMTYGALAAQIGKPGAYRAVGATNGLNPVAIVLPCHRVIGANAALTGYAGGLERKQWLLQHESSVPSGTTAYTSVLGGTPRVEASHM
jgi:methylated-DNA-[protein]-cysteine S-methyltransferase